MGISAIMVNFLQPTWL